MARTPFKMRSGNSTPFKQMGSSPMREVVPKQSTQKDAPSPPPPPPKKAKSKSGGTLSYKQAYEKADKSKYDTYEKFETAAKAWNVKKYGTTEPTKASKKYIGTNKEVDHKTITSSKGAKVELAKEHHKTTPEYKAKIKTEEAGKLEADVKRRDADVKSGKAKKIVSSVTGEEATDYRPVEPETKKRTKTGKLGVQIGNIFRGKGRKKNPHRKVIKTKNKNKNNDNDNKRVKANADWQYNQASQKNENSYASRRKAKDKT
jgi:hypothetical protein